MARMGKSEDWGGIAMLLAISAFESLAMEAYSHLPEKFRSLTFLLNHRDRRFSLMTTC